MLCMLLLSIAPLGETAATLLPTISVRAAAPRPIVPPSPEEELARFPSPEQCAKWIEFGDKHVAWVERRCDSGLFVTRYDEWLWRSYLTEMRCRLRMWRCLHNAQHSEGYRRAYLNELREQLGEELYKDGWVPIPYDAEAMREFSGDS